MEDAQQHLPDLTEDVLIGIFSFCNGDDVVRFSNVNRMFRAASQNRNVWKALYIKRYGCPPEQNSQQSYKEQYEERERMIMCIAEECTIAHLRFPHWETVQDPRSVFGTVARLHAVSWLHVFGTLRGIHTGSYRVVWRLAVLPRAQCVFNIVFRAKTKNKRLVEARLPHNIRLLEFGSDYFDFVLSDLLEVTEPFEDVDVECKCTSREWKTNLMLCSVRLEPAHCVPGGSQRRGWEQQLLKMDSEGLGSRRLRRLKNLRSHPGASYRPWQPWTALHWYEPASIALFFAILVFAFALLLQSRAT